MIPFRTGMSGANVAKGVPGVSTNFMLDLIASVSQVCLFFLALLLHLSFVDRSHSFRISLASDFHSHEQALAICRLLISESFSYPAVRPSCYPSSRSTVLRPYNIRHHEIVNHCSIVRRSLGVGRNYEDGPRDRGLCPTQRQQQGKL